MLLLFFLVSLIQFFIFWIFEPIVSFLEFFLEIRILPIIFLFGFILLFSAKKFHYFCYQTLLETSLL